MAHTTQNCHKLGFKSPIKRLATLCRAPQARKRGQPPNAAMAVMGSPAVAAGSDKFEWDCEGVVGSTG